MLLSQDWNFLSLTIFRQLSDYVDEICIRPAEGNIIAAIIGAIAPERRLAPKPRPDLQAAVNVDTPTLMIIIQQATNLASSIALLEAGPPDEALRRPRMGGYPARRNLQMVG
jgi:hypothetical protein